MTKNNKRPIWKTYMSGDVGDIGFYIKDSKGPRDIYYGPFKTEEFAEFFNFIAFGSPRELDARLEAAKGIVYCEESPEFVEHPKIMFASNSRCGLWVSDTYGQSLTTKLILEIAKESGAMGYKSFANWIVEGSKINGSHLGSYWQ
ncbi:hypothetical protein LCGC14_0390020 [marine sediment metagenome]|uniref:Uncharacterized protein n=1 Tax=marine sediment metagenome TaxID=412755 RepID=A0A0F9SZX7_9ZZZZ